MRNEGRADRFFFPRVLFLALGACLVGILFFPLSPEDWVDRMRLGEASYGRVLLPFGDYPYYRPLWFLYLRACTGWGLPGGLSHMGPILAHLLAARILWGWLREKGLSTRESFFCALGVMLAPGTAAALSWLAAGNKAMTFFFLILGLSRILRAERAAGALAWALATILLALGCSENAYMAVLLLPGALWWRGRERGWAAWTAGAGLLLTLLPALLHLWLSPQGSGLEEGRLGQLLGAVGADPLGWFVSVLGNLGGFFFHGLGLPWGPGWLRAGLLPALLLLALIWGRRARGAALLGLLAFVLLNVPASFFPGESSRHQGYLPALGAGLSLLGFAWRFRKGAALGTFGMGMVFFFLMGNLREQALFSRYLHQADRVLASIRKLAPSLEKGEAPLLLNVPVEYRAGFLMVLGKECRIDKWPSVLWMTTRSTGLFPDTLASLPEGLRILEYRGGRIVFVTKKELLARRSRDTAWFLDRLSAFPGPVLALGPITGSEVPLQRIGWSLYARGSSHGFRVPRGSLSLARRRDLPNKDSLVIWEVKGELEEPGWLVLAWVPEWFPPTERARLFVLEPFPWPFEVEVETLEGKKVPASALRPVLGFFPALPLGPGSFHLRVRLKLR
ncbi:MAG TPA: hypothetical protein ENK02_05870 [Planctomycetes bacterium]|nr:hypothetical protein [Planctomycetota bacterium]